MAGNISFEKVKDISGIDYVGTSYGASWGDFNGDNYPDLYVSNHTEPEILYLNQGDGTFVDISSQVFPQELRELKRDTHGAAWADFDNDGDQDLIQLVGAGRGVGTGSNQMYVNDGGTLKDQARELGIDYSLSRGRTPLWLDFDKDGLLDLFQGANSRSDGQGLPTIFRQTEKGFEDVRDTTSFALFNSEFGFLSDLSGDGNLDGVFRGGSLGLTTYDLTEVPFEDLTPTLISDDVKANDITSADFNRDLRPDLYLTRSERISDLVQTDPNTAKASIISQGEQQGVRFESTDNVTFNFRFNALPSQYPDIYIGASGLNPNGTGFTLSADDPDVEGIFPHTPGVDKGIYIGYDSTQKQWQMLVSSPDREKIDLRTLIDTSDPISDLTAVGFNPDTLPPEDRLLLNTDEGLVDQSQELGINSIPIAGNNVVSGDLDNDMDLDLYVVATGTAGNRPNILYENQGDGTFIAVPGAGGAEGTNLGVGDSVATADYDLDGFLDLFVTNGSGSPNITQDAPYELFRNQGNNNNWLEIDLEGVVSNRDGIGAQVFVTAGGITQLREQSGGVHHRAQNHQRLHFGLANNNIVDEILIKWTNGQEQKINNVPVNQLLHIIEPIEGEFSTGADSVNVTISESAGIGFAYEQDSLVQPHRVNPNLQDEMLQSPNAYWLPLATPYGQPEYDPSEDSGVFLWKSDRDSWHLRVVAGTESNRRYVGSIISDTPATFTEEVKTESNDLVNTNNPAKIDFDLKVSQGFQDGIDFSFSEGASLTLNLEIPEEDTTTLLQVGAEQWSVSEFPLDLSGW